MMMIGVDRKTRFVISISICLVVLTKIMGEFDTDDKLRMISYWYCYFLLYKCYRMPFTYFTIKLE